MGRLARTPSPRSYHCVPPHSAARWGRCVGLSVGTHQGLEEVVERQWEWPLDAEARLRCWFMRCPPQRPCAGRSGDSGPGDGANATGLPATPPTRERARSARQSGRPHPAALGETVRFRPLGTMPPAHRGQGVGETVRSPVAAPCPTPTAVVAGPGAGVSGCCGGGASSLGETTGYSPSSRSPLRPYARCPMQRATFLAFIARG